MFHRSRSRLGSAVLIALALALTGCGGSDDTDSTTASGSDIAAVATCLENRGFDVTAEANQDEALVLPDAYKDSVGLVESLWLGSIGDTSGTGGVDFFTNTKAAEEEQEAGAGFRTDDVLVGISGSTTWNYIVTAGDDPGVRSMITACIG